MFIIGGIIGISGGYGLHWTTLDKWIDSDVKPKVDVALEKVEEKVVEKKEERKED